MTHDNKREVAVVQQQVDDAQLQAIGRLLARMPWGDLEGAIFVFERALRLAVEATTSDLNLWESEALERGYEDEFSVTPAMLAEMTVEWRLAYVARLLETVAIVYGPGTELGPADEGTSARNVLHGLRRIVCGASGAAVAERILGTGSAG